MISGVFSMFDQKQFVNIVRYTEAILQRCNVPAHLDGFNYVAEAVAFKLLANPRRWVDVYNFIADKHGVFTHSVVRSVNYIIHNHFQDVQLNFGLNDRNMFASAVISALAIYVKPFFFHDDIFVAPLSAPFEN